VTLWRLEWLRLVRTRRLVALGAVYAFFGLVGPLTARYLAEIIDRFGGDQMQVTVPDPTPVDGIAQFSANASQIGLLVVVVVAAGALAVDAVPEMAIFLRTRVGSGFRLLAPRLAVTFAAAAGAFVVGTGVAWYETAVLLGSPPAGGLLLGTMYGIVYLAFAVAVTALAGTVFRGVLATGLASLLALLLLPVVGIADPVGRWLPSHLVGAQTALVDGAAAADYLGAASVAVAATVLLAAAAIRRFGAREL
jgi:ABC-2 type transport system permease protein